MDFETRERLPWRAGLNELTGLIDMASGPELPHSSLTELEQKQIYYIIGWESNDKNAISSKNKKLECIDILREILYFWKIFGD